MKICPKVLPALTVSALASMPAQAALLASTGQVANLRTEGSVGFVGLSQPFAQPHGCGGGTRVWVDMNSPIGRAAYASAMMALAMQQNVAPALPKKVPRCSVSASSTTSSCTDR